jgi:quercetin dioxygenase-like cupin family protein
MATDAKFTGAAELTTLHQFDGAPVRVSRVSFPAGVVTHWHQHTGGQLLVVVTGQARVQRRGEEVIVLAPGESCVVPPNVEHWHGASDDGPMTHLAISGMSTLWGEAPSEGSALVGDAARDT